MGLQKGGIMTNMKEKYSRRLFLRSVFVTSSSFVMGLLWNTKTASATSHFRKGFGKDSVTVNVEDYEELKQDGGFIVIKELTLGDTTDNLIIVRLSEKEYLVLSSVCRHKKCNVKYKDERKQFVCPCHGSTYDLTGKVVKGPSTGDIPQYDAVLSGSKLTISPKQ
jgi:cytochrome b6-f complex iron-sulfur subunit